MTKAKGRRRIEKGLKDLSVVPPRSQGVDPKLIEDGQVDKQIIYLTDEDRVVQRLVFGDWGQVLDFAISQQILQSGEWRTVIRYDCAHGRVHADVFIESSVDAQDKVDICDAVDADSVCQEILKRAYDEYQEQRRRYTNGRGAQGLSATP